VQLNEVTRVGDRNLFGEKYKVDNLTLLQTLGVMLISFIRLQCYH
jgi:hypothetical protein